MIKHVLYIQPIFVPDENQLQRNIRSFSSFADYLKTNGSDGIKVSFAIGGWAKTDDLWNSIVEVIKDKFGSDIEPLKFGKNYGKAVVMNKLYELTVSKFSDFDAILSSDSDIVYPKETENFFGRASELSTAVESLKGVPWGIIAPNQSENNCHWKQTCYENVKPLVISVGDKKYNETLAWPTNASGIAGSCWFVSKKLWDALGGYAVMGVYAGDDAIMLVMSQKKGFSWQIVDTLSVVHPRETDESYIKFKVKVCGRDTATGIKSDISNQINETDDFWNTKRV